MPDQMFQTSLQNNQCRALLTVDCFKRTWRRLAAHMLVLGLVAGICFSGGRRAMAQERPNFGPNVFIFDPSMSNSAIQSKLTSLSQEAQFSTNRYAAMFMPGTYDVQSQVGYYESVTGLGESPSSVTINGSVTSSNIDEFGGLTTIFWRSMENLTENSPSTLFWGVSQGTSLRRMQINSALQLTNSACNFSSGGFISDSIVTGNVNSCSQQQWFTRNSKIGSWSGSNWNMVFSGVEGAPFPNYPSNAYTVLPTTPVSREKPFLYVDERRRFRVFVPTMQENSSGVTWSRGLGRGYSLSIDDFLIALPTTPLTEINQALAQGRNLILTPGVYKLTGSINVTNPNTVVLGMGYATLVPQTGTAAIKVSDVDGVRIASVLIDAGPVNSPVLVQIGNVDGSRRPHRSNPTSLNDVFFRVGGGTPGTATTTLEIDSNDVILDNIWAWRADHGNGVGFTVNVADHGVVVNGDDVTALGLFVEHYEKEQVLWNGERGATIFYQSELPYDPPNQSAWMDNGANGYPSYVVSPTVAHHAAYGFGVYSFFNQNVNIIEDSAIMVPNTPDVTVTHAVSVFITGSGSITHTVDDAGGSVMNGNQTNFLPFYQGVPCTFDCPIAPNAPRNLKAFVESPNQVNLFWSPSFRPGVRYSVFRSLASGFVPSSSNLVYSGIIGTSFEDNEVNPGASYFYVVEAVSDMGISDVSNEASVSIPSTGGVVSESVLQISAGGGASGSWVADEDFTGGTATSTGDTINTSLVPNPAPQSVYQANRFGPMTYTIPGLIPNGKYIVDLHFAETFWTAPGQRQFNVLINGKEVLRNFDIFAYAGAKDVAFVESLAAIADKSGMITIEFTVGAADNPQINGIEIGLPCKRNCPVAPTAPKGLSADETSMNQINLSWTASATSGVVYSIFRSQEAGFAATAANELASGIAGTSFTDTSANPATTYYYAVAALNNVGLSPATNEIKVATTSAGGTIDKDVLEINAGGDAVNSWVADEDFSGGTATNTSASVNTSHVANPAPLSVYQTNRFGPMTYTIPGFAAGGKYVVELHFAETFWTAPGQRQFNVLINGVEVLKNYDIYASAGGEFIATVQSFFVTADNTGSITIQFVPGAADQPQINGIEIGTGSTIGAVVVGSNAAGR
jgi:fibronectin type 3 domain-containing protein